MEKTYFINRFLLIFCILGFLLPGFWLGAQTSTQTQNYSLDTPKEWKKYHNVHGFNYVTLNDQGDMVIAVTTGPANVTLDQFFQKGLERLQKNVRHFSLVETGKQKLNGTDSQWVIYKGLINNQPAEFLQFFVINKDLAYLITFQVPEGKFDGMKDALFKIAGTFKILE
jgi:hypothetical protein